MKKSLLVLVAFSFLFSYPLESQGLLNKMKKAVTKEISGVLGDDNSSDPSKPGPEPACAESDDAGRGHCLNAAPSDLKYPGSDL